MTNVFVCICVFPCLLSLCECACVCVCMCNPAMLTTALEPLPNDVNDIEGEPVVLHGAVDKARAHVALVLAQDSVQFHPLLALPQMNKKYTLA